MAHLRLVLDDETPMGNSSQSQQMFFFFLLCLFSSLSLCYGYDSLDPNGNVTIKWDIMQFNGPTYDAKVTISNFQLFRHVEPPGWRLRWDWAADEVIWKMFGAEATQQGNCSLFKGERPHSCEKSPIIVDLLPGTSYNQQVANCCKGGVLSSINQDPSKYAAMFQMNVGGATDGSNFTMPENFTLGVDGYTCGAPREVEPSQFTGNGGRRWTQAASTFDITCVYSQFRASANPKCCVSLSAFYNSTIVSCPECSCRCQGLGAKCLRDWESVPVLQMPHDPTVQPPALVRCTNHMCPIRIHWHVKQSYKAYWRVKITITNFNAIRNYSDWNLVVQHPNLDSMNQVFSFNYKPLDVHGYFNDTGMFWGVKYYNDLLLQSGKSGNVQTEILLSKEHSNFSFGEGWAFPRKIFFNGDDCVMPQPDDYPRLPNAASGHGRRHVPGLTLSIIIIVFPVINQLLVHYL